MQKKSLVVLTSISVAASMLFTGCGKAADKSAETEEKEILSVEVVSPEVKNVEVTGEFVGTLEYADETPVYSKLAGEVTATYFEEGDFVEEGAILFDIDDEAYQLSLRNAQATYQQAQAGVTQQLGALAMQRDTNVNSVQSAQEGITQAQNSYGYYEDAQGYLHEDLNIMKDNLDDLKDDKDKAEKKLKKARKALKNATSASEEEDIRSTISSLKTAINTYDSSIDQLEISINTYESNIDQLGLQKSNACYSYNQAVRGEKIAEENLQYFDQYTVPGTQQSADATLDQAQVALDSAKLQLGYTKVAAPVSGIIKSKNVDVHGMAAQGQAAYVITNEATLEAVFYVPAATYQKMKKGQAVTIERDGEKYECTVTDLPTEIDASTNLFKIKASLSEKDRDLISGTSVKIYTTTDHAENTLTVPIDCVYYDGGTPYVYTVENGIVRKTYVTIGMYNSESMEIKEGLESGMQVITSWSSELRDGLEVEVKNA